MGISKQRGKFLVLFLLSLLLYPIPFCSSIFGNLQCQFTLPPLSAIQNVLNIFIRLLSVDGFIEIILQLVGIPYLVITADNYLINHKAHKAKRLVVLSVVFIALIGTLAILMMFLRANEILPMNGLIVDM